jgi:spore maturation protein CgeB
MTSAEKAFATPLQVRRDDSIMAERATARFVLGNKDELGPPPFARNIELLIIGASGWTHIGSSLRRAAKRLGTRAVFFDIARAFRGPRVLQSISWHFAGHRPLKLNHFANEVVAWSRQRASHARVAICTGAGPLTAAALVRLKAADVFCINYSTDDPWNHNHRAEWHLRALKHFDIVFTTRRSNIQNFQDLGCADVRYLPFAYDDGLFSPPPDATPSYDVLFVGGADRDRVAFIAEFMRYGLRPTLVGGYWGRFYQTRDHSLGTKDVETIGRLTAAAAVNLCLVRRANRDGHVMRSFEIPAVGGFMLAEDTTEHRDMFGAEGSCVLYFKTPEAAAEKAAWALANPDERQRMAGAAHARITNGKNTYADRLVQMLSALDDDSDARTGGCGY